MSSTYSFGRSSSGRPERNGASSSQTGSHFSCSTTGSKAASRSTGRTRSSRVGVSVTVLVLSGRLVVGVPCPDSKRPLAQEGSPRRHRPPEQAAPGSARLSKKKAPPHDVSLLHAAE